MRQRIGAVQGLTTIVAAFLALAVVACNPIAGFGLTVRRDGNQLNIVVPGYRDANTHGYLCPADPGPGPDRGEEGHRRLLGAGCLDLGVTETIDPDATGWSAVINLESLASAQLEAFSERKTYRLVLVSGDAGGGQTYSTDIPAVNLVP
jgi:hypothetical protein